MAEALINWAKFPPDCLSWSYRHVEPRPDSFGTPDINLIASWMGTRMEFDPCPACSVKPSTMTIIRHVNKLLIPGTTIKAPNGEDDFWAVLLPECSHHFKVIDQQVSEQKSYECDTMHCFLALKQL